MRILYYFRDYSSFMYQWQHFQILDELYHYGIEVEIYTGINEGRFDDIDDFSHYLRSHHNYDLFMTSHGSDIIKKDHVLLVHDYSIPTLLICFDNLHAPFMHKEIANLFDLVWLTSKETEYYFRNLGCLNIIFQTYASNPFAYKPHKSSHLSHSVTFIGTPYGSRINKINALLASNINVDLYYTRNINKVTSDKNHHQDFSLFKQLLPKIKTFFQYASNPIGRKLIEGAVINKFKSSSVLMEDSDFLNWTNSLSFDNMVQAYSESSLALNITELRNTYVLKKPVHKMHLRTFEIPMCGGLEICSYFDELASYFKDGSEIVLYKDDEELIDKAKYYISPDRDNEVFILKRNARKRAIKDHTWYDRFITIFNHFGMKYPDKIYFD